MRFILFFFACVILISECCCHAQSIRVATYNLNWGNRRGEEMLGAIREADADIVCFQETTDVTERFLKTKLRSTHPEFHSFGHNGHYFAERFSIASRMSLDEIRYHPPAKGLFGFVEATIPFGGEKLHVVNVHLTPFVLPKKPSMMALLAESNAVESKHRAEMDAICDVVDPSRPTIILGDFNSISSYAAPKKLRELGFVDSFASVHDDADRHSTWHWPTKPLPLELRVDYIFHSGHVKTFSSKIIRRSGSDHSLVVSELRLVQPSAPSRPK